MFSVYTPLNERQPSADLTRHAKAHDIKYSRCDGNDVSKVNELAFEAIEYIEKIISRFLYSLIRIDIENIMDQILMMS